MEPVAPFLLSVPRFKQIQDGKDEVIYYYIEIAKRGAGKWSVEKRFREFDELDKGLRKLYGNMPSLPSKSLLPLKESVELERRRDGLEKYLQKLVLRTDILSSEPFKRFLQLENFASEITVTPPKFIGEVEGLALGVRDFHYQADQGLLFVLLSDMNVASRVDSYLTNMKMPWEKDLPQDTLVTVGALECYLQVGDLESGPKFDKMWGKTFQTQAIILYWDQPSCTLLLGNDDGTFAALKVSAELNYVKYDEIASLKLHESRIMGIYFDSIPEVVYTASEDKRLKVYNLDKNVVTYDLYCGQSQLTALVGDKENKRIFISNRLGQVFVFDISPMPPVLLHTVQAHSKGAIRGLFFDSNRNYLLASNYDDGVLTITDMQKPGKEKYAHVIASLSGKPKVRFVTWSTSRSEAFTGGEDGNITFWDAKKASPVFALNAHAEGVTKLQWLEKRDILVTGGKDKKIKFYKLPVEWRDKKVEHEIHKEEKIRKQTEAMVQFKRLQQRRDEDSDEDDLAGWARD